MQIRDVIDVDLDLVTLELLSTSHPANIEIEPGRELVWSFDDILLPYAASDELHSHGFVRFRIRPRADLPEGAEVLNSADIFFDANAPVLTGTTINSPRPPRGASSVCSALTSPRSAVNLTPRGERGKRSPVGFGDRR